MGFRVGNSAQTGQVESTSVVCGLRGGIVDGKTRKESVVLAIGAR